MTGLVILLLLTATLTFFAPRFGWQIDTVLSGSMEPALSTGSILVSRQVLPKISRSVISSPSQVQDGTGSSRTG